MVVKVGELGRREWQGTIEQRSRRTSEAAPVTALALSSDSRSEWLLRRRLHHVAEITSPSRETTRASL